MAGSQGRERHLGRLLGFKPVETNPLGDAPQPGAEPVAIGQRSQRLKPPQQRLLRQILGGVPRANAGVAHGQHRRSMTPCQLRVGGRAAVKRLADEFPIRRVWAAARAHKSMLSNV